MGLGETRWVGVLSELYEVGDVEFGDICGEECGS